MKKTIGIIISMAIFMSMIPAKAAMTVGNKPDGWNISLANGAIGSAVVTDEKSHSGKNSMLMSSSLPYMANRFVNVYCNVALEKDKTYEFGCWAKGVGVSNVYMCIDWENRLAMQPFPNYDWMEFKGTYTATKSGNSQIMFLLNAVAEKIYIDDLFVYEIDEEGNRIGDNCVKKTGFEEDDSDVVIPTVVLSEAEQKLQDLQNNKTAPSGMLNELYELFQTIPLFNKSITIDGNPEEWSDIPAFSLSGESASNKIKDYAGEEDCSLDFQTAYDENNFYLYAKRTDDVDVHELDDAAWSEINARIMNVGAGGDQYDHKLYFVDSIQFALSDGTDTYELGIAYPENKVKCFSGNMTDEQLAKISAAVEKSNSGTRYEIAVPWTVLFDTDKLLFDIIVNDKDEFAKFGSIQWNGAMDSTVDISKCRTLKKQPRDFLQLVEEPTEEKEATVTMNFNYYLVNNTSEDREYILKLTETEKEIVLPAKSMYYEQVPVSFDDGGEQTMVFTAKDKASGDEMTDAFTYNIEANYVLLKKYKEQVDEMANVKLPRVKALRDEVNAMGITTQYEDLTISVLERNIQYTYDDIEVKEMRPLDYNIGVMNKMFDNTEVTLNAYKSGEKTSLIVPEYKTSLTTFNGEAIYAQTDSGEIRPVFLTGYGHFVQASDELSVFNDYGAYVIQRELPLQDTIKINANGEFYVDGAYIRSFDKILTDAENYNVKFDVLLPQHYISRIGNIANYYTDYNSINNPLRKEILSMFYEAVVPVMAKHSSLISFTISNEPYYRLLNIDYDLEYYHNWLKEHYGGNIEALNKNYGSSYTDFSEITIPEEWYIDSRWSLLLDPYNWADTDLNRYIDWYGASCQSFADYHIWMANEVKKHAPDIPLHAKIQGQFCQEIADWGVHFFLSGNDLELTADVFEINGCDAMNFQHDGRLLEIFDKLQHYDYLTSVRKAPVFNSEDHITIDGDMRFNEAYAPHHYTDIWQGAIHGRTMTALWLWSRSTMTSQQGHVLYRPDSLEAVGRASFDLNRLSYEVVALQNQKREVAMLYDRDARVKNTYMQTTFSYAYGSTIYNGERMYYITPKKIMEGELEDYKVLILPEVLNMDNEIMSEICEFIKKGGRVIIIGRDTLKKQKYAEPVDENLRSFLFENSAVIDTELNPDGFHIVGPSREKMFEIFRDEFDRLGLSDVKVIDNETGLPVYGVEINETVYEGKHIINMCNHTKGTTRNVSIEIGGRKITEGINRMTEESIDCTSITLKHNEPIMISVG